MMGRLKRDQGQVFYSFHLNEAVPAAIDPERPNIDDFCCDAP